LKVAREVKCTEQLRLSRIVDLLTYCSALIWKGQWMSAIQTNLEAFCLIILHQKQIITSINTLDFKAFSLTIIRTNTSKRTPTGSGHYCWGKLLLKVMKVNVTFVIIFYVTLFFFSSPGLSHLFLFFILKKVLYFANVKALSHQKWNE